MNPASPFSTALLAIVSLSLLGLPIGHAMIGGSVLYLLMTGLDMGTAAEQLLNGMYSSFVLLAIPLFILAAEFMTIGSITERLLAFCNAFVGRFRGGLAHVNVVQSIIFAGMSGSALADAASSGKLMQRMMTQDGKYTASFAAALTAASSVIGPRTEETAVSAAAKAGVYLPSFVISVCISLPEPAASASAEPDMLANTMLCTTFTWARPPR